MATEMMWFDTEQAAKTCCDALNKQANLLTQPPAPSASTLEAVRVMLEEIDGAGIPESRVKEFAMHIARYADAQTAPLVEALKEARKYVQVQDGSMSLLRKRSLAIIDAALGQKAGRCNAA